MSMYSLVISEMFPVCNCVKISFSEIRYDSLRRNEDLSKFLVDECCTYHD